MTNINLILEQDKEHIEGKIIELFKHYEQRVMGRCDVSDADHHAPYLFNEDKRSLPNAVALLSFHLGQELEKTDDNQTFYCYEHAYLCAEAPSFHNKVVSKYSRLYDVKKHPSTHCGFLMQAHGWYNDYWENRHSVWLSSAIGSLREAHNHSSLCRDKPFERVLFQRRFLPLFVDIYKQAYFDHVLIDRDRHFLLDNYQEFLQYAMPNNEVRQDLVKLSFHCEKALGYYSVK